MGNEASTLGDMYSYGILLLEMFTGKKPTDNMFDDNLSLRNYAKMALPEQVASVVDPTLFHEREKGEAASSVKNAQIQSFASSHQINECLTSILKVGIACSEEVPRDRMSINDVITQFSQIRNTLLELQVDYVEMSSSVGMSLSSSL